MADRITERQRSANMSRVRSKDTGIEVAVRKDLFKRGFRYKKNDKTLPGTPDIVLPKYRTVVFVNGCFWHQHEGCKKATIPKTRVDYWQTKLYQNKANDKKNIEKLHQMGWNVIIVWECELKTSFDEVMNRIVLFLKAELQ